MTQEYKIISRMTDSKKIQSNLEIRGIPTDLTKLSRTYLNIYTLITEAQENAIREGNLEQITTSFKR